MISGGNLEIRDGVGTMFCRILKNLKTNTFYQSDEFHGEGGRMGGLRNNASVGKFWMLFQDAAAQAGIPKNQRFQSWRQ